MATIDDVARKAGVSTSTVSRSIRNVTSVRERTRSRVMRAVEELRYRPNLNACVLAGAAVRTIGVIVPSIENPFFFDIYKAVSRAVQPRGFEVVLKATQYREEQLLDEVRQMIDRRVAGLVVAGSGISKKIATELAGNRVPTICYGGAGAVDLCVDYSRGVKQLVGYLRELGHRRIGMVEHFSPSSWADPRIAALRHVLPQAPEFDCRTVVVPDTFEGGRLGCRALLAGDFRPTAIICAHDVMAIGALREAREQGYRMPRDLSVAGLDNITLARFCVPTLTTVHIARDCFATALCASLFTRSAPSMVDGGFAGLDCELIVRESTAAPGDRN